MTKEIQIARGRSRCGLVWVGRLALFIKQVIQIIEPIRSSCSESVVISCLSPCRGQGCHLIDQGTIAFSQTASKTGLMSNQGGGRLCHLQRQQIPSLQLLQLTERQGELAEDYPQPHRNRRQGGTQLLTDADRRRPVQGKWLFGSKRPPNRELAIVFAQQQGPFATGSLRYTTRRIATAGPRCPPTSVANDHPARRENRTEYRSDAGPGATADAAPSRSQSWR